MSNWKPVTQSGQSAPFAPGQIEFVMTPGERDCALVYQLRLEMQRREQNKRDEQRRRDALAAAAAKALEEVEFIS